jgi:hypothetical protein
MIAHAFALIAIVAAIALCMSLPFLPGGYDPLAAPLSAVAQTFGIVGLVLVPIGITWSVSRYWSWHERARRMMEIAALVAVSTVWLILALVAVVHSGFALGTAVVVLWAVAVGTMSRTANRAAHVVPLYLVVVPLAVATLQSAIDDPITEFSRTRAIRNSMRMIADIERYRDTYGQYPASMVALWNDYRPGIIGVKDFKYERYGDAYNVLFEPFTFRFGTKEIVMYNPRDEHGIISHDSDLLRHGPDQWHVRGGYYAVHDAPHPHWKYFWFD